jgi:hypothetical protein
MFNNNNGRFIFFAPNNCIKGVEMGIIDSYKD